jgi:hypothetical protein
MLVVPSDNDIAMLTSVGGVLTDNVKIFMLTPAWTKTDLTNSVKIIERQHAVVAVSFAASTADSGDVNVPWYEEAAQSTMYLVLGVSPVKFMLVVYMDTLLM